MLKIPPIVLIAALLCGFVGEGQEKETRLSLNGYIKNLFIGNFEDKLEQFQGTIFLHNRLNLKYRASEAIGLRLEFRNRAFYGDNINNIPEFSEVVSRDNGWADLSWNLVDTDNVLVNSFIDRASVNYSKGDFDLTVGRQRVNWGMNLIWNPNDIFNTYNFLDFDYEERPGSDAIRIQYYLGYSSKIELAAKKGRANKDHIIAAMYKFNTWTYDIQFITGIYQKDWVIGTGWAGNLENAGFKGEITYFLPFERDSTDALSASVSVDYGFKKGLYVHGSALYNSAADEFPGDFESLLFTNVTSRNLMPFEFAGFLQLSKEISPVFSASFSTTYSPTAHSVITIPMVRYSIATNWEFDFTGQSFFEFQEYKSLGHSFFARLRWSF